MLVIEEESNEVRSLSSLIKRPGHNVFIARSHAEAEALLNTRNFVIIFLNLDNPGNHPNGFLNFVKKKVRKMEETTGQVTLILTSKDRDAVYNAIRENHEDITIDYLMRPYDPDLVKVKLNIYRKLYFKHQRISQLLESILPTQTLKEFQQTSKSSPKKKANCTILFTDFVNFSEKTRNLDPRIVVQQLDYFFTRFDAIILKYNLEKIKTIGDAYMVVGGVTENDPHPAIRTGLAALEIRNFMQTYIATRQAFGEDFWEIRIGIHIGDLVAGVVGQHKFSYDVWGHDVNIAARCEQNSLPNKISISGDFESAIAPYFEISPRGKIQVKHNDSVEMFFLERLKPHYSLYGEGRLPNVSLRKELGLPLADFEGIRTYILTRLKAELDEKLIYHSYEHTEKVEEAVIKYGELENLSDQELILLRTAALFHDSGFLFRYEENETLAVDFFRRIAPDFGYEESAIEKISEIIMSTAHGQEPKNLLEAIMCDADLDYLGRMDYHDTAEKLFTEEALFGKNRSKKDVLKKQIEYLSEIHQYYTVSANNLRAYGKMKRLAEVKEKLRSLNR